MMEDGLAISPELVSRITDTVASYEFEEAAAFFVRSSTPMSESTRLPERKSSSYRYLLVSNWNRSSSNGTVDNSPILADRENRLILRD